MAEQQKVDAHVNALTLGTVYYILHSYYKIPHRTILDAFATLTSYIRVADVTAQHIQLAMESTFNDFEDAVIFYSAKSIMKFPALSHAIPTISQPLTSLF